ncbi:glycosyltransferase [Marinobacter lipolyticus]|nr:glycosyltransferase [Marinobacter lipolyticus]
MTGEVEFSLRPYRGKSSLFKKLYLIYVGLKLGFTLRPNEDDVIISRDLFLAFGLCLFFGKKVRFVAPTFVKMDMYPVRPLSVNLKFIDWRIQYLITYCIERIVLKRARCFVFSESIRESIENYYRGVSLEHVRPGCSFESLDLSRREVGRKTTSRYLLYVGRLDVRKNINILLEAMKHVEGDAALWLVGDGPARKDLERKVNESGLSSRILFLGYQSKQQLVEKYSDSEATVLPTFFESFGHVVLESLYFLTPVIGFKSNGVSCINALDDFRDFGRIYQSESLSAAGLGNKINEVLRENAVLLEKSDKEAHRENMAKSFCWESFVSQVTSND